MPPLTKKRGGKASGVVRLPKTRASASSYSNVPNLLLPARYGTRQNRRPKPQYPRGPVHSYGRLGKVQPPRRGIGKFFKKIGRGLKTAYKKTKRGIRKGFDAIDTVIPPDVRKAIAESTGNAILMGTEKAFDSADNISHALDKAGKKKGSKFVRGMVDMAMKGKAGLERARGFVDNDLPRLQQRVGDIRATANQAGQQFANLRGQARTGMDQMKADIMTTKQELAQAATALGQLANDFRGGMSYPQQQQPTPPNGYGRRRRRR